VKLLVLILSVMFAYPAFGASGDACNIADTRTWMEGDCTVLCDEHNADTFCTPTADGILIGYGRHRRIRSLAVELHRSDCSAGDAKIYSRSMGASCTDCPWHYIGNIDLDADDDSGVSLIAIDGIAAAPMAYMKAVVSGKTCTSDGATILIHRRGALEND